MPKGRMKRVHRYSNEFKITAIKLAGLPGPLFRMWLRHSISTPSCSPGGRRSIGKEGYKVSPIPIWKSLPDVEETVSEQRRIRELEVALKKAKMENDLLKKIIRFNAEQRHMPSPLLTGIIKTTVSPSSAATSDVSRSGYYAWKERPNGSEVDRSKALHICTMP